MCRDFYRRGRRKKQIPCGNDNKKGKGKSNRKDNGKSKGKSKGNGKSKGEGKSEGSSGSIRFPSLGG